MEKSYSLTNEQLQIKVRETGAELCSIRSLSSGREYMWNADPDIWSGTSPILFPIVGALKDDSYYFQDKKFSMPRHGFVRNNANIRLASQSPDRLTFQLGENEDTLKNYPFRFKFLISYTLKENTIQAGFEVINQEDEPMFFSLGGHPALKCPLEPGEKYSDYYLEFKHQETARTHQIEANGLIGKTGELILDNSSRINLNYELFTKGALVFKDLHSHRVSLLSMNSGKRVQVDYEVFPYLGIWAKPHADFVCIEPWMGIADSVSTDQQFETKEGIIRLEGKGHFKAGYSISIF